MYYIHLYGSYVLYTPTVLRQENCNGGLAVSCIYMYMTIMSAVHNLLMTMFKL